MAANTAQCGEAVPTAQSNDPIYRRSTSIFSRRGTQVQRLSARSLHNIDAGLEASFAALVQKDMDVSEQPPTLPPIIIADDQMSSPFEPESSPAHLPSSLPTQSSLKRKPVRRPSTMCSASRSPGSRSQRFKTDNARIGVWVEGVTYWGETTNAHLSMIVEEAAFSAYHPAFQHSNELRTQDAPCESSKFEDIESALVTPLDRSFDVTGPHSAVSPLSLSALGISTSVQLPPGSSCGSTSSESEHDGSSVHLHDSSVTSDDAADDSITEWPVPGADRHMPRSSRRHSDVNKPLPATPSYLMLEEQAHTKPRRSPALRASNKDHIVTQSREYIARRNQADTPGDKLMLNVQKPRGRLRSPTLSEAETDLRLTLENVQTNLSRASSVRTVLEPPTEPSPILPRRSRKREWRASRPGQGITTFNSTEKPSRRHTTTNKVPSTEEGNSMDDNERKVILHRSYSTTATLQLTISPVELPDFSKDLVEIDEQVRDQRRDSSINTHHEQMVEANPELDDYLNGPEITHAFQTENVLVSILATLTSIEDLHNMALTTRGMYRVYQENEMQLLSCVLFNMSPPAAEYREWSYLNSFRAEGTSDSSSSFVEQTPIAYLRNQRQDTTVIEGLKISMMKRSASVVRQDTLAALSSSSHPHARRIDDAFWRIWCFSAIFACEKDREDDLVGQLDWLKGGELARSGDDCAATVNLDLDFEHNSVLLNPPEFFARGNKKGLTSQQLFDMLELWTCMSALLDPYHGRIEEAKKYGVFDGHEFDPQDPQAAHTLIEEWTAYILTLGPDVVLKVATASEKSIDAGFSLAQNNGWTSWSMPQYSTSRRGFLKDAVTRLYTEQLVAARHSRLAAIPSVTTTTTRAASVSQPTSHLAREIRLARHESTASCSALAAGSRLSHSQTAFSFVTNASNDFRRASHFDPHRSALLSVPLAPVAAGPRSRSSSRVRPQPPPRIDTTCGSSRPSSAIQFVPPSQQLYGSGEAYDTSTRAIGRLVDMGFLPSEVREALKVTDPGDGLRLDRAVEYLLQRRRAV